MTTNYDPIAEQYKRSKPQPWRTHIEAFTLMRLIGDPTGKTVVDIACGVRILHPDDPPAGRGKSHRRRPV